MKYLALVFKKLFDLFKKEENKQIETIDSNCPIKIGDYFLQRDGGYGKPILRKRVEVDNFDDLFKNNYYPYGDSDEKFIGLVERGHFIVISQDNPEKTYKQCLNTIKF